MATHKVTMEYSRDMESFLGRKLVSDIKKIEVDISQVGAVLLFVTFKDGRKFVYSKGQEMFREGL